MNVLTNDDFVRKAEQKVLQVQEAALACGERLPLLKFPQLEECSLVEHCFTTRLGGVSEDIFASFNLSFTRGDRQEAVAENYRRLAEALGVKPSDFVMSNQTHTTNVLKVGRKDCGNGVTRPRPYTDVDGLITDEPGVVLSTFFADCVPLYFVDPVHKAIGLSHSGWRGTVNRMGKVTLEAMQAAYGTNPADVIAAIGPSICQDCYEVSGDVALQFAEAFPGKEDRIFYQKANGKYQLDLWESNRIVLTEAGVLPDHLSVTDICTCCNPTLLFSHRASHGRRGNLGAFLYLRSSGN